MLKLNENGIRKAEAYIKELEVKRKEILDAGKDTADDTNLPTVADIQADLNDWGFDVQGDYLNGWGVTDNYDADRPLSLTIVEDFYRTAERYEVLLCPNTKQYWVYDNLLDVYIDPPAEVLDKVENAWGTDEAEHILYQEIRKEPDWLNDREYFYDSLD